MGLDVRTSCHNGLADHVRWVLNNSGRAAIFSYSDICSGGVQENQEALKLFGTRQRLVNADDINLRGENRDITYLITYLLHGAESLLRS